jgi:hypothetical protein
MESAIKESVEQEVYFPVAAPTTVEETLKRASGCGGGCSLLLRDDEIFGNLLAYPLNSNSLGWSPPTAFSTTPTP